MAKINESSTVPITWLIVALYTLGGLLFLIASWVFQVNYKLARIEKALHLEDKEVAQVSIVSSAAADTVDKK